MKFIILLSIFFSSISFAAGWTSSAVPTRVDIERGNGLMVYGAFGNPGNCTTTNKFYVLKSHPQYQQIHATVLAAFMAGKKVDVYIHTCQPVPWYSVPSTTYNTMDGLSALNLTK